MNNSEVEKIIDLQALSSLLDEALDLPLLERRAWLESLPDAARRYHDQLQEMLARAEGGTAQGLIDHLPSMQLMPNPNADPELAPGDLVGDYRLLRVIGRGGMGTVWLAERADGRLRRQVALKLPLVNMSHKMLVQRFERERDILAGLEHPNIARLYDAGFSASGQPYLAMEYVQGEDLTRYCDERRLSLPGRLELFRQVLDAVQYAHANLVVHRDLKPANILVSADGRVHLLDFGIAKLLAADEVSPEVQGDAITKVVGMALTPEYASPEQFLNEPVSIASDVYSLGVLLYELLSGERPYQVRTRSRAALEAALLSDQRTAPSAMLTEQASRQRGAKLKVLVRRLRGDLDNIILKALKAKPVDRYATVNAFAEDLQRWRAGEPVQARADSRWYRMQRFVARNKLAFAAGVTVIASMGMGMGVALWQAQAAKTEAQISRATEAFLKDLFNANSGDQPDPASAQKTTARDLLDRGGQRIAGALDDAPDAKLRIYQTLIDLNQDLALNEPGYLLQQRRLALLQAQSPRARKELASELIATGEAATASTSGIASAVDYLTRAQQMLDALGDDQSTVRGRLEIAKAAQLDADNCKAVVHAQRGVDILRLGPASKTLLDGLLQLMQNQTYCKSADLALATGREAIALIHTLGRTSRLPQAYETMSSAYMGLGQIDKGIEMARQALDAAQSMHPPHAPPDSGTLNAAANLVTKQVGFAHSADALATTQPLIQRALAALDATDRDGLVSVLMHQAQAYQNLGQGQAALENIQRTMEIMGTFEADDSQRVMVLDRYADILGGQGQRVLAAKVFQEAASLHAQLHHDGTGQANEHVARQVRFALLGGRADHAERALAAFLVRPSATGAVTKPQLEHRLMQAEIALARGDWRVALTAAREVQERQALYPLPHYVRDLSARALTVQGTALKAVGRPGEANISLKAAQALQAALLRPTELPALKP